MNAINADSPIMVTGASGYIASWIVKYLLEAGHRVHGTVRDLKKPGLEHLHGMARDYPGRLELFQADLLTPGSFHAAMYGCELVMHTASPFIIRGFKDAHEALVRPAVEGTQNVFKAVEGVPSVKRVVLTSSVAAIFGDNADLQQIPGGVFTEADWNISSRLDHQPYSYSKTAAEREAWALYERQPEPKRWELVTINPGFVFGPSLAKSTVSNSIDTMKQFGDGTMKVGVPALTVGIVDVRDVAQAHVQAGFSSDARGRYIVSAQEMSFLEMAAVLRSHFGSAYPFPRRELPKALVWLIGPLAAGIERGFVSRNVGYPLQLDNRRGRVELGLTYRPVEQTLVEHFQQMLDDKLVAVRP